MAKSLQELTIKDNFMFVAVMTDEEICKDFLEMVLGIKIARVTVEMEKTILYNPGCKGVRLDIEAEDEAHTHYDVEMQVTKEDTLRRARYYHSQMDMELLESGKPYQSLGDSYVIFICDYDPFDRKKYRYTLRQMCLEAPDLEASAGTYTVFLSTKGKNKDEVPEEMVKFLKYVGTTLEESEKDFRDPYVEKVQKAVKNIKHNRGMGERYMLFAELLEGEHEKGVQEGIQKGIQEGIQEEIFLSIREGDYSEERGAQKMNLPLEEFRTLFLKWKEKRGQTL